MKSNSMHIIFLVCVLFSAVLFFTVPVSAQSQLVSGDIYLVDSSAPTAKGGVYKVDPITGQPTVISSAGNFEEPIGIAITADGSLLVGDHQALGGSGAIIRVNPANGAQTIVSSGGSFVDPRGLAIAANGDIFVADSDAFNYYGGVIKVNPATGQQTAVYTSTDQNAGPVDVAIAANGDLLVSDVSAFNQLGGVIRVNPVTQAWSVVSSGGNFVDPWGIAVAANGDIFVADNAAPGKVIKVNPSTGAQTVIASGWPLSCPTGIAVDNSGNLLVDDPCNEPGATIKVNPISGTKTLLASFGSSPHGIDVVPQPQVCTTPPSGMVSWWTGDGNTNDIIDSNPGTLQNGATFTTGQVGSSFSFDGVDDKVLIGNPVNLRLQDFTIDAWIKLRTMEINYAARITGYSIGGYGFFLPGSDLVNPFGASAVRQLSLDKAGFDMVTAPFAVNDTGWHHVAVTKSGGTVTFYHVGIPGAAQRGGSNITFYNPGFVFNTNFMLGNLDGQVQPFPGLLDEVEVFNRALSASEIQSIFNAGSAGKCKQPVAVCGNGNTEAGEQCDDGNTLNGDCCSSTCQFESAATVCRSSAGVCDVAESCTGSSAQCSPDVKSIAQCRASTGQCDIAESCDGINNDCPQNSFKPDSSLCNDGLFCNINEACYSGVCTGGSLVSCSDGIGCTYDSCDENLDRCNNMADNTQCPSAGNCDDASGYLWTGVCNINSGCTRELAPQEVCDGKDNNCNRLIDEVDNDGDRFNDCNGQDKCTGLVLPQRPTSFIRLNPNSYALNNQIGYGCTCEEILAFCKPGGTLGQYKYGCSQGTYKNWLNQRGWAIESECQVAGKVR